ncbi:MAG TPA: nuclear transport factor 2 family protein [Croceibacterium sp.]|nr:nuclear transport factor 2 family protein [Croceibacterium sp.]
MCLGRRALLLGGAAAIVAGCAANGGIPLAQAGGAAEQTARLEDIRSIREIKRLQHLWGHYADAGQWAAMAALFTPAGVWTDGATTASGRNDIHALLRRTMGGGADSLSADRLNLRLFMTPVITLSPDGQSARGRWHEVALTGQAGRAADWAGGIHVIDYARDGGNWKIARMHYHPQYAGPYAGGWHSVSALVGRVDYHYTPDQAGTPVPRGRAAASVLPDGGLAARAELLMAASLADNLVAAFGFYLDRQMHEDIADLFTTDGSVEIAGAGRWSGRDGVLTALHTFGTPGLDTGELNDRPQLMPVVTVAADGASASVRVIEIGMTGQHGGETFWSAAVQTFDLARGNDGKWRIAALHRTPRMRATYADGWARPLPGASYPQTPPAKITAGMALYEEPSFTGTGDAATLLARAEAFDGAENVSNAYGYYIDEFEWNGTADLFSIDGWKELSYIGTYVGRERVRGSLFNRYGDRGRTGPSMAIHQKTQPYVTPSEDGSRANIRLRLFQFNSAHETPGSWISGIYENQAVLENGVWKIHGMDLDYVWLGDYTGGWAGIDPAASSRFRPRPEDVAKYPPDAPLRGVTFAPFPEVAPMGFHFANPVSGRQPATFLTWSDGYRQAQNDR